MGPFGQRIAFKYAIRRVGLEASATLADNARPPYALRLLLLRKEPKQRLDDRGGTLDTVEAGQDFDRRPAEGDRRRQENHLVERSGARRLALDPGEHAQRLCGGLPRSRENAPHPGGGPTTHGGGKSMLTGRMRLRGRYRDAGEQGIFP